MIMSLVLTVFPEADLIEKYIERWIGIMSENRASPERAHCSHCSFLCPYCIG